MGSSSGWVSEDKCEVGGGVTGWYVTGGGVVPRVWVAAVYVSGSRSLWCALGPRWGQCGVDARGGIVMEWQIRSLAILSFSLSYL